MDDRFRTSDADRGRVAGLLRDHFAAGRLTQEELEARLTATLNAKTLGDLRSVLAGLPGPASARQHRSRPAPETGRLERGYRWLLFFYPAAYRRVHEEEMLAVLMTAAPAGKRRPGMAEAADLIWGALRVRCQPSRNSGESAWRDALAALSVIVPVLVLAISIVQEAQVWLFTPGALRYGFPMSALQQPALAATVVALVVLRLRRAAALAAGVMFLWTALFSGGGTYVWATAEAYLFVPLGLEIAALAASAGPRRGMQILTWKHGVLIVIATAAFAINVYPVTLIVMAVIGVAMALASPLGRWLLVLLAIAVWPFVWGRLVPIAWVDAMEFYLPHGLGFISQAYLLPAALLAVFAVAAHRESRHSC